MVAEHSIAILYVIHSYYTSLLLVLIPVVVFSLSCKATIASSTWRPCRSSFWEDRSFLGCVCGERERERETEDVCV